MRIKMVREVQRKGITFVSRNFGCGNNCGCQGCAQINVPDPNPPH